MTNADVVEMVKAGLSEQIITTSIRQASAKSFDLSPAGLISLKKAGVSDAIIQVLQEVTSKTKPSPTVEDNKLPINIQNNKLTSDDKELAVNTVLKQRVAAQSRGAISLVSFRKTNGYEQGNSQLYVLEWQSDIIFEQSGYKAGDMFVGYWQDFSVLSQKPGTLDSLVVGDTIRFDKGTKVRLTGNSTLRKTEQGWRIEDLSVKSYRVLVELYVAPSGEFSYNPPDGWELKDVPGMKYKVAALILPAFANNIAVIEERVPKTLDDLIASNLQASAAYSLQNPSAAHTIISQTDFQTNAGQRGVKIIVDNTIGNNRMRSYVYYFDGKNGKGFQVVCTALQKDVAFEKVFDASMKTFKMFSSEIKTSPSSSSNDKTLTNDNRISPTDSNESLKQELIRIQNQLNEADIAGDKETFNKLLADGYLFFINGKSYSKDWLLKNVEPKKGVTVTQKNVKLSLDGETAILTGITVTQYPNGSSVSSNFISKFVKHDGLWKKVSDTVSKDDSSSSNAVSVPSTTSNPRSFETLISAIEKGEEVFLKVKCDAIVYPRHNLYDGYISLSKTAIAFNGQYCGNFAVTPQKILKLTYQTEANRIYLKVAVPNKKGNKEDKLDILLYNTGATAPEPAYSVYCNGCDNSISILYELLKKITSHQ